MEIISKAKLSFKFKLLRPIMRLGKRVEVGEEIELDEADRDEFVAHGRAIPCDLPPVGVYIALTDLNLPGNSEKFSCKKMELVSLKAEDALRLMLAGMVIPKDETRWRPGNRRLRSDKPCTAQMHHAITFEFVK